MKNEKTSSDLDWLRTPIQYAKGVGPQLGKLFLKLKIKNFEDLLYHTPFRYLDRRNFSSLDCLSAGKNKCIMGEVFASGEVFMGRRKVFEVILSDGRGHLVAKWFHYSRGFFQKRFIKGAKFLFFGEVALYRGEKQMIHPEVEPIKEFFEDAEAQDHLALVPVYPKTEGLHQKQIRKIIYQLTEQAKDRLRETLPLDMVERLGLPSYTESIQQIHQPDSSQPLPQFSERRSKFHKRLIFDEFFYLQLGLGIKKRKSRVLHGFAHDIRVGLRDRILSGLPFEPTQSQIKAIEEISFRMCSSEPMNVLLQGDVGSGKTLVALLAALLAIENDRQAAMMVPTEILAEQHAANFKALLKTLNVGVSLLTASTPGEEKKEIFSRIRMGESMLVVGTHALLEEKVDFQNLSLVIIDEQHRFGVRQRMRLMNKGRRPDVLVMTATPIPRSLAMTLYGDLDLCLMTDMPKGRKPVVTRIMYEKNRPKLYEFVRKKISQGRQAYFVFPLIEESEKLDLKDATRAFERLQKEFSEFSVAMIHGRMKSGEKEAVMEKFSKSKVQILVATTVIEVGIDVPNATLMVIEHAERFGLSQLHQLRGRVGRGTERSFCVLGTGYRQSENARARLKVMEEFSDGFKIAEEDLKIRGPGDFLGTRQSGLPDLRIGNLVTDLDLLELAKREAQELLEQDPHLSHEMHQRLLEVLEHRWSQRLGMAVVG